jgi:hypothetical protein
MSRTHKVDNHVDAHTALVTSRGGQVAVALIVLVMGVWIVGPNMPASPARNTFDTVWAPPINAGFEQNWWVFSPNPRSQSIEVSAIVEYADGTSVTWSVPDFDPIVGAYRSYRWRKWQERIRLDANIRLWDSSAEWIAKQHRRNGELPTAVRLIRSWTDHGPLTNDGAFNDDQNQFEFYLWESGQ